MLPSSRGCLQTTDDVATIVAGVVFQRVPTHGVPHSTGSATDLTFEAGRETTVGETSRSCAARRTSLRIISRIYEGT